ncbi:MAG: beta-ketoacyl-ACP reductase [Micavibrio sp.]|nr:beta-ketoacyl-ACP reductase [Micavibrio sp.]|tara:strand:- start:256 stop:978 length:723 start_codon:yes stop_codon:yes gene_type:complete
MNGVAIVTGGTRGIGLDISKALIADGLKVAAVYHGNEDAAQKFRDETGHHAFKFDVSDYEACEKWVEQIEKDLGPVSVLVNNAGITKDGALHKMPVENWHAVIETNLTSCFNMSKAVVGGMRERGYGRIINISSINGQKGQFGQTNYSAAKAGMIGFTKALALESAAKGITVNAICPGYIETDMTAAMRQEVLDSIIRSIPAARMGKPDEIAAIVSFLASDKAGFMNGSTISANGGQYMS